MSETNGTNGKHKKKLTLKQKKFAKAYIQTNGNGTKAAEIAGYKHPMQQGSETLRKLDNNSYFLAMMDKAGLSERKLFKPIKDGLEANHVAKYEGEVLPSDEPDHEVRMKASELAFKLRGKLNKKEEETQDKPMQVLIINYGKPDTNSGNGVQTITASSNGTPGPVKISDDYLAPKGKKNNPSSK